MRGWKGGQDGRLGSLERVERLFELVGRGGDVAQHGGDRRTCSRPHPGSPREASKRLEGGETSLDYLPLAFPIPCYNQQSSSTVHLLPPPCYKLRVHYNTVHLLTVRCYKLRPDSTMFQLLPPHCYKLRSQSTSFSPHSTMFHCHSSPHLSLSLRLLITLRCRALTCSRLPQPSHTTYKPPVPSLTFEHLLRHF